MLFDSLFLDARFWYISPSQRTSLSTFSDIFCQADRPTTSGQSISILFLVAVINIPTLPALYATLEINLNFKGLVVFLHLATHFHRLICIDNLLLVFLFMSTVDTKIFGNLHEFLKAGDRQCCARCRTRRAQTLPPMQPMRKAKQFMPRWRQESGDGARVPIDAVAEACDG